MEYEEKKGVVINFKPRDEFSKFEDDFKDPQIEAKIETLDNNKKFKKRLVRKVMTAISKEKGFTGDQEPISIYRGKPQREKWEEERKRQAELSAVDDLPDNVIPFRRKLK